MIGILDADGKISEVVSSLAGVPAPYGIVDDVPYGFLDGSLVWNGQGFVENIARAEAEALAELDRFVSESVRDLAKSDPVIDQFRAEKRHELERWIAAGSNRVVTAETFPFFVAEAAALSVTVDEVVAAVESQVALWATTGAAVESLRVAGRAAIRAGQTAADKAAACQSAKAAIAAMLNSW